MSTINSLTLKPTPLTTDTIELNDGKKATLLSLPLTTAGAADASSKVSAHAALTDAHGATSSNTASRIVSRNADGSFSVSGIQLDTAATPTSAVGFLRWNETDKCAEIQTLDGVVVQLGQESNIYARNESGSTLANGKAVVVDGSVGQRMTFILADSTSAEARKTIGLVTSDSGISNNGFGFVTTFGLVRDLNTAAFTEGDELFLSTAGNYITTKPVTESSSVVRIGWVIRAHATQGSIFVAPNFHGTAVGDSVMNATSKAAARTAIGAAIGTDVQAWNTNLDTFSTYTPATLPVSTATQTALDGKQRVELVKSSNFTAVAGESYVITSSATVTDPASPVNGQSYRVRVSAGTATVGGEAFSAVGAVVTRSYNDGAWSNAMSYIKSEIRVGYQSPGAGGRNAALPVTGLLAAVAVGIDGEHYLQNNWGANNVLALQNDSNGYSAVRFLNFQHKERGAAGYGNIGTDSALSVYDCTFLESSQFIDEFGAADYNAPILPLRLVTTGKIGSTFTNWVALDVEQSTGDTLMVRNEAPWSSRQNYIRFQKSNGFMGVGVAPRAIGGATAPCAPLDVWGNVIFGANLSDDDTVRQSQALALINLWALDSTKASKIIRATYEGVFKFDLGMFANTGLGLNKTLRFIDTDNSVQPLVMLMDGTGAVAINKSVADSGDMAGVLDVYGSATVGNVTVSRAPNATAKLNVYSLGSEPLMIRLLRDGVGKSDLNWNTGGVGKRLDITDTDNTSVVPLSIMMDGSGQIRSPGGLVGNASTATALATSRTINGVSFDGTANVNVPIYNARTTGTTSFTAAVGVNTFTGSTAAQTVTLPAPTSTGTIFFKNQSSVSVTLASASGSQIFTSSAQASITVLSGDSVTLWADGTYWNQ